MALVKNILYVADTENHAIRCIYAGNVIVETIAGGRKGPGGDGGPAAAAVWQCSA